MTVTSRRENSVPSETLNDIVCVPTSTAVVGLTLNDVIKPPVLVVEIVTLGDV